MMDVEKLISVVFENRCLWDMKQKNYHDRDKSRQTWEKIASEMETTVEAAKNKWRGLRDTFRKELNKIPKTRSGQEGGSDMASKWPYFKIMMFLKDQFTSRKLQSSILEPEIDSQVGNESGNDGTETEDLPNFVVETNENVADDQDGSRKAEREKNRKTSAFVPPPNKRAKTLKADAIKQLLNIEEEKLQEFKRNIEVHSHPKIQEDADYHFLMSLLPYLRKIPEDRKMDVRMKLQGVFSDEQKLARQQCASRNSESTNPSRNSCPSVELSRPSSVQSSEHHLENYGSPSELTTLSGPSSVHSFQYPMENYDYARSPELVTLSRPSSENRQYENLASCFAHTNPYQ